MPQRVDFWGIPQPWGPVAVYLIVGLGTLVLVIRFALAVARWVKVGYKEGAWDHFFIRLKQMIVVAFAQVKIFSDPFAGILHAVLAWGFFVFFLGTALATINSHIVPILQGGAYLAYKLALDGFTIIFLIGAALAGYRRWIQKPIRLTQVRRFNLSIALLIFIVLNGLIVESLRLAIQRPAWGMWSPAGWLLAQVWISSGASDAVLHGWHVSFYFVHFISVSLFFISIPELTLRHIITAPLNAFFSNPEHNMGRIQDQPKSADGNPELSTGLAGLTWKQLLESEACTECGRCQAVCPIYTAGGKLNPRMVEQTVRKSIYAARGEEQTDYRDGIADEVVWACTTCAACNQACPILIRPMDTLVGLRRGLVTEGSVDPLLQDALGYLNRLGNSAGEPPVQRPRWTDGLTFKIKDARKESVEYLWFVGDTAAYNPAAIDVTRTAAEVLHRAGVDFGILYEEERNSGNDVRRTGEEGLYEQLAQQNIDLLQKCHYKAILTTDPHTYNTLKNEYPSSGLQTAPVYHISELLDQMIEDGRLKFSRPFDAKVTYHDPCYLGRYNGIYAAPRRVLAAAGCQIVEMPRNRENGFCCGAGGGHLWMEESPLRERPSEMRIREAAALEGVETFVVACPKDLVMYHDAVLTTEMQGRLVVKDLVEIVRSSMG